MDSLRKRILVPFLSPSVELARRVRSALELSRFELVTISSVAAFKDTAAHGGVGVVGLPGLGEGHDDDLVPTLVFRHPNLSILAITHAAGPLRRVLGRKPPPNVELLCLPWERYELSARIGRVWLTAQSAKLRRRIREAGQLPFALRTFIAAVLELRPRAHKRDPGWSVRPHITVVCAQKGVTRSQVYTQATEVGFEPRKFIDAWRAVQLVAVHDLEHLPWSEVGGRAGYASLSGSSDLVLRALGYRPSALPTVDVEHWLRWFEEEWLEPLLGSG